MANIFSNHSGLQRKLIFHNLRNSSLCTRGLAIHRQTTGKILSHSSVTGILECYCPSISSNSLDTKKKTQNTEPVKAQKFFQKQRIFDTSVICQFEISKLPGRNLFLKLFQSKVLMSDKNLGNIFTFIAFCGSHALLSNCSLFPEHPVPLCIPAMHPYTSAHCIPPTV